jgi:hypothetical protein
VSVAALLSATLGGAGCSEGGGSGSGQRWSTIPVTRCTGADTWVARGFQYEHFATATPGALLVATIRTGEVVSLRVTTLHTTDVTSCDSSVAGVGWVSTAPEVAALAPPDSLEAALSGLREGETAVSARLTLSDGSQPVAELYAVPREGSVPVRVYSVRVVR